MCGCMSRPADAPTSGSLRAHTHALRNPTAGAFCAAARRAAGGDEDPVPRCNDGHPAMRRGGGVVVRPMPVGNSAPVLQRPLAPVRSNSRLHPSPDRRPCLPACCASPSCVAGVARSIESDVDNLMRLISVANILPKGLYVENAGGWSGGGAGWRMLWCCWRRCSTRAHKLGRMQRVSSCCPACACPPAVKVAKRELKLECDYRYELQSQQRFKALISGDPYTAQVGPSAGDWRCRRQQAGLPSRRRSSAVDYPVAVGASAAPMHPSHPPTLAASPHTPV